MKSPYFEISPNKNHISLDKIPVLSTSLLLHNMTGYSTERKSGYLLQNAYSNKKIYDKNKIHSLIIDEKNEGAFDYPTTNAENSIIENELNKIYEWNTNREKQFKENCETAKKMYSKKISSSNWYELAFLPMVQEINLDFKKKKQRDLKLEKYGEGEYLTAEELKFIVDTSLLINSCIDKKFLKSALEIIDDEVIKNVE